jgi:hypothetical protein
MPKRVRPTHRVKNLTTKMLTGKRAKNVRGGVGMLLPAVQKVREAATNSSAQACDGSSKDPA